MWQKFLLAFRNVFSFKKNIYILKSYYLISDLASGI